MQIREETKSASAREDARGGFYRASRVRRWVGPRWSAWRTLGALALLTGAIACVSTPVTGRRALNLFSQEDDMQLGAQAYSEYTSSVPLVTSGAQHDMVVRVMQRIVAVTDDPGYEWEVRLLDDPKTVNAFCLPGGKMAVYTGILPVTKTEAGLAAVMGHEIGHAVARHGTERMSNEMLTGTLIGFTLQSAGASEYQELALAGKEVLLSLPWGRKQELEADRIGLMYMARAGYDPREAIEFWKRMAALGGGGGPEWLSTHPSDAVRVRELEALLPEALAAYQAGTAVESRK